MVTANAKIKAMGIPMRPKKLAKKARQPSQMKGMPTKMKAPINISLRKVINGGPCGGGGRGIAGRQELRRDCIYSQDKNGLGYNMLCPARNALLADTLSENREYFPQHIAIG